MTKAPGRIPKEAWIALLIATVVAVVLRVSLVTLTYVDKPFRADAGEYVAYARNLVDHGTFSGHRGAGKPVPDSFRAPGYPLFLAGVMAVAGEEHWYRAVLLIQALLGAALVPLSFLLARRFLPAWGAVAVAALTALSPHLVTACGTVLTEGLTAFVLLLGLLLFSGRRTTTGRMIAAGGIFGIAWLASPSLFPLPFLLAATAWWGGRRRLRTHLAFLLVFFGIVSAWTVRNALSVPPGAPTGSERALRTLSHGAYPGFVFRDPKWKYYPYRDDPEAGEFSRSLGDFWRIFRRRFRERPLRYLSWYLLEKPYHLLGWDHLQGFEEIYVYPVADSPYQRNPVADATRYGMKLLHPVLVLLALAAAPLIWMRRRRGLASDLFATPVFCLVPLALALAVGMVFAPWPRYLVPLRPELYAAAVWPVILLLHRRRARG